MKELLTALLCLSFDVPLLYNWHIGYHSDLISAFDLHLVPQLHGQIKDIQAVPLVSLDAAMGVASDDLTLLGGALEGDMLIHWQPVCIRIHLIEVCPGFER